MFKDRRIYTNRRWFLYLLLLFIIATSLVLIDLPDNWWTSDVNKINSSRNQQNRLNIYVSIYPLYDLANKIGGNKVDLHLLIPNGEEVHSYKPSLQQQSRLLKTDLFLYNGVGLEPWGTKVAKLLQKKGIEVIKASEEVKLLKLENTYVHSHGQYDPHIWLDPINMQLIAKRVRDEFIDLDPENKREYQQNYKSYTKKIDILGQAYRATLTNRNRDYILVSHDAFRYLTNRYGLNQLSVTGVTLHEEPSPGTLAKLIERVREDGLKYIFMKKLSNSRVAGVLAKETGLKILTLDPIIGLTEEEKENNADYFSIMSKNLKNLRKALVDEDE